MATVTTRFYAFQNETARGYITYDDVTLVVSAVRLENDSNKPLRCTVTNPSTGHGVTAQAAAGVYQTWTVQPNLNITMNSSAISASWD